jgi:hypothetical protein
VVRQVVWRPPAEPSPAEEAVIKAPASHVGRRTLADCRANSVSLGGPAMVVIRFPRTACAGCLELPRPRQDNAAKHPIIKFVFEPRMAISIRAASLALDDVNVLGGASGAGASYGNSEPCCALQAVQSGDSGLAASAQR